MQLNEYIARKWFQASAEIQEWDDGDYDEMTPENKALGEKIITRLIELIPELQHIDMNRDIPKQIED